MSHQKYFLCVWQGTSGSRREWLGSSQVPSNLKDKLEEGRKRIESDMARFKATRQGLGLRRRLDDVQTAKEAVFFQGGGSCGESQFGVTFPELKMYLNP